MTRQRLSNRRLASTFDIEHVGLRYKEPLVSKRSHFVVTFTPTLGVDGVRALRWLLKRARRQYGLIAVDAREESAPAPDISNQIANAFTELRRDVAARRAARNSPQPQQA